MNSVLLVAIPLVGSVATFLVGVATKSGRFMKAMATCFAFLTAGIAVLLLRTPGFGGDFRMPWIEGVPFLLSPDHLSMVIAVLATLLGALIVLYSVEYMAEYSGQARYYGLLLLFVGAMAGMVLSGNMLQMFFFWELVGVCSYSLIGFRTDDQASGLGGMKAFITTKVGDIGLFSGIVLLYAASPSSSFEFGTLGREVLSGAIDPGTVAIAGFLMIMGAAGKSAQLPLHVWLPDAMEAPTSVSALIHAATMVNSGIYLMMRVYPLFSGVTLWSDAVMWTGAITALAGATMAVYATDLKRLLAYSTVSQLGIMMFAVGSGALTGALYHLVNHAVFKALLFLSAGAVIHEVGTREIAKMGGLRKLMPVTSVAFLVGSLALAGIPPVNGFWSKDLIISESLEAHHFGALAVVAFASILTAYYSIRTYRRVFLGVAPEHTHVREVGASMRIPLIVLAFASWFSWAAIGFCGEAFGLKISVPVLVHETLNSPALYVSLFIIGAALLLLRKVSAQGTGAVATTARHGFYFDRVYAWASAQAGAALGAVCDFADERLLSGTGRAGVRLMVGASRITRTAHTGDANFGLAGVFVGLIVIAVIVFAEVRFPH